MESWMRAHGVLLVASSVLALTACRDTDEDERTTAGAMAVDPKPANAQAQHTAKIGGQQAIAAATAAVPGSAQEVRLESRGGKSEYEVTVLPKGGSSRTHVEVDAATGQVTRSGTAPGDDDEDEGHGRR
jgi:uncharacterized membrane protein YkoI